MKLYLAASYLRRAEIQSRAAELRALGHTVTSTWHDRKAPGVRDDGVTLTGSPEALSALGYRDLREVAAAEVLIAFTEPGPTRGGHHWEAGFASGLGREIWVVGERVHVFHHLHGLPLFADWDACREHLERLEEASDGR